MIKAIIGFWALLALVALPALANESAPTPSLTAGQIVAKNVAARGGLEAWRKIETMVWTGHIDSSSAGGAGVPFLLAMKRPNKTRFEIHGEGQLMIRAFDGTVGWRLRTSRSGGRPEVQDFTPEELRFARDGQSFDGPLIDYQAKGLDVRLDGLESVDGVRAYRLSVRLPSGLVQHIWVDAKSFLEIKSDRLSHAPRGGATLVTVYYRDYQKAGDLMVPALIETGGGAEDSKMIIEKFAVNPPLEERQFSRPLVFNGGRHEITIGAPPVGGRDAPQPPAMPAQQPAPVPAGP